MMGSSQAVTINTDLLCKITLLDSNVGAEFGEFTGGVVSAETCSPQTEIGKIHGSLSYDYTSDHWSDINFLVKKQLKNLKIQPVKANNLSLHVKGSVQRLMANLLKVWVSMHLVHIAVQLFL